MKNITQNLSLAAIGRVNNVQALIDKLNNTTVGGINSRIDGHGVLLALIHTKINTLASLFGIVFNADGTLNSEAYTTHTHSFIDSTITDTADGTGIKKDTTKTTTGVK